MYEEDIFNAIYSNNMHEYIIIDRYFHVLHYSKNITTLLDAQYSPDNEKDIFKLLPELIGLESDIEDIFDSKSESFLLPCIHKQPKSYINIRIHPGKLNESDETKKYKTLVILLEDVSTETLIQQKVIQERNEKVLLLDELAEKNRELKHLNTYMQEIIDTEVKKNLETQKMVELQSRHAQMGEMIAMITHQWKQPLSSINMTSIKLDLKYQTEKLDKKTFDNSIQTINEQTKYMKQTVNDFQQFFNPVKKKMNFDLHKTILGILKLVQHEFDINNISLEVTSHEEVTAYGFPNEYNQVIVSILSNAKDAFLNNPHPNMKIMISIKNINQRSVVTIKDNAGGIPNDIIDQIFDIYISTKTQGSGLGLNISKNIIENNMNGKIEVKNVKNGTEFSIIL